MSEELESLIERCLKGDQSAWSALVDQYAGLVYAVARRCGLREDQCDDVAQAVFSTLVRRLSSIREPKALAGWLSMTAQREAWRVKKHSAKFEAQSEGAADAGPDPSDRFTDLEQAQRVREALAELGHRCQEILKALAASAKPDYAALSQRLGIPMGSIGPTRARCLAKLGELLGLEM
ncbi:MAG: RNA polymerase sigma factor [Phycisphaerales bacterium]